MINIQSPFLKHITQCKLTMRKMRKKITKHFSITRTINNNKEQNQDLLNILKSRNLPHFIIEPLKKRRTFDINFLKNVTISKVASLDDVIKMACNQENQIQKLFAQHEQRMRKTPKKVESTENIDKNTFSSKFGENSQRASIEFSSKEDFKIALPLQENHFESQMEVLVGGQFLNMEEQISSGESWFRF